MGGVELDSPEVTQLYQMEVAGCRGRVELALLHHCDVPAAVGVFAEDDACAMRIQTAVAERASPHPVVRMHRGVGW
jgi:hypothetical protein